MLDELARLKAETEEATEEPLTPAEMEYLEQIKTTADLTNYDRGNDALCALAWDAALALGLSKEEAAIIAGDVLAPLTEAEIENLRKEYRQLVRDCNLSDRMLYEARQKLLDEIGRYGFGEKETRKSIARYEEEVSDLDGQINDFEGRHPEFMEILRQERKVDAEKAFERLMND